MNKKFDTRKIVTLGLFCAMAFVAVCVFRIPIVQWLKYEPKDAVIVMGGFLYGPMAAAAVSVVVSVLEFATISDTGLWGMLMNIVSTCSFAFTAAYIYKLMRTQRGAYLGLFTSWVVMVAMMLLWNYLVTPFYMGVARADVAKMLIPVFLPFNAIKGGLNVALTLLMYKPLMRGLRAAHLVPEGEKSAKRAPLWNVQTLVIAGALLVTCILVILAVRGVI